MPLLKWRKWARNSSVRNVEGSAAVGPRSKAEKRAVGRRMLITLGSQVNSSAEESGGYSPDRQERVIQLSQMRVEVLFPDTRPSNKEGGTRDEQQVQDNDTNDSGLEHLQAVGSCEVADAGSGSVHSLALSQKDDGQSGFHGVVESDCE